MESVAGAGDVVTRGARRRRRGEDEERGPVSLPDMLDLPFAKAGETREDECPICLVDFLPGGQELIRTMPCSHSFHQKCIFDWLVIDRRCPMCRFAMPPEKRRRRRRSRPVAPAAGEVVWSVIFDGSRPNNGIIDFV
jgi:hypothetical protein